MTPRLLALDADGTLLDSQNAIRPAVVAAIRAARERGVRTILCTGRRYRTALPLYQQLDLEGPQVVQNGVLVKDARSGATLASHYLAPDLFAEALALMRSVASPLVYIDSGAGGAGGAGGAELAADIVCEPLDRLHPYQVDYLKANTKATRFVRSLDEPPDEAVIMLSCMADSQALQQLRDRVEAALGDRVRSNFLMNKNYRGHILEIVSKHSGKWPALRDLAQQSGIETSEILAIGDDENDAEMIEQAGIGVAMGNAVRKVRDVANHATLSNDQEGVARAIERFILSI